MTTETLNSLQDISSLQTITTPMIIISCLVILDFVLKWITLYKSWKREQLARFICIFIFNTCWILPIIYLIINREKK